MATVKRPVNPVREEAQTEPAERVLRVEFLGQTYVIEGADVDDLELFELIEDGKGITAVRQILGPERWAAFKANQRAKNAQGKITMEVFNDFLQALMDSIGGQGQGGNS